ncbi:MAG: hypothetical protein US86_C0001G0311 [Candidatus Daviesbacteria bacterium GW2011_GWA2_38_24]|uniref:PT repeat-containing protein n=1 Tax=Candidatus Daviesbacteria bacterium GW2011_GWA2_38_24 TaxID=1618422 RepID=A0A0G0M147_9BACT|nr:MAG: hypothetical protein US86_C0001G0311 [Candidatus Daviesbacteria bacterium GW2011_GWA2_38_24]KKQ79932.1 MAG: hypothetical protein UT01_C0024G0013 [Candidatus Daviesbacteria bacterium GW2011_GWA1_38_7]
MFSNLSNLQKGLLTTIIAIVVYAFSATISYSIFASSSTQSSKNLVNSLPGPVKNGEEDDGLPKTEECPLNGAMHSKKAKDAWEQRLPLAVMIENHQESRPQSGLTKADVVYETVAEGGITRFMAMFLCNLSDIQVGPVRSVRTYFLDWLSEYPLTPIAHVGGANTPGPANALGQLVDYKLRSLNQFGIGFPTYWRDYQRLGRPVATEHTMYSTTHKLWAVANKKSWTASDSAGIKWDKKFVPWDFKDDDVGSVTQQITVNFWNGYKDYVVEWNYDSTCNCYKRKNGGADHMDLNNNKQLSPKNIVIRFMKESRANDGYENNVHLIYANKGQGKGLLFQDGKVTEITWAKKNRLDREKFFLKNGKEVSFNRGQIWLQAVPEGAEVVY